MSNIKKTIIKHRGLSKEEVEEKRRIYGENKITRKKKKSFAKQYLESFGDPTIKILLVVLLLNVIFFIRNFNWYESIGIAVSIILATLVSSISEYGSQLAFERLMDDAQKIKCKIWRDNELNELPVSEVVTGDYIQLESGDKIPADGILIFGSIEVDQSALNGETKEAHKKAVESDKDIIWKDIDFLNPNMLFSGSVVCDKEGTMLVQAVGDNTFYGKLAKELQEDKQDSPLKKRLKVLARTISRYGYLSAGLVFFASLFHSVFINNGFIVSDIIDYIYSPYIMIKDILRAITMAITVVVVAVPEGLPLMITVVLSSNMKRMIHDNVLVRKLVGIETAGSLNILFTDKTGTLTKGQLKVSTFMSGDNIEYNSCEELKKCNKLWDVFYISSVYNNSSQVGYKNNIKTSIGGNSTDRALLDYVINSDDTGYDITRISNIPFKSENKFSATKIEGDMKLTLVKGAAEKILPYCTKYYNKDGDKEEIKKMISLRHYIKKLSSKGVRVLALATSDIGIKEDRDFSELVLVGIVGIKDEVRSNAKSSILNVTKAGIQVVMITGDGKDTACAIAIETGLVDENDETSVITSDELNKLDDDELKKLLPSLRVVARAMPSDKTRLVRLSQSLGLVAGMTGDGVNDAPALKKADVGFSMGSGSEIAKEASDIVILDDNFLSIGKAILYGRTIFKSIRKFIIFQLSINVCAVGISVIGQFIGIETPITVVQMLWVNMVMDTLAGLAFAGEAPLPEYMEEPPKKRNEKIINKYMAHQIFCTGFYTTIMCILFLKLPILSDLFRKSNENEYLMTGFFAFFMFSAIFNSLNARTHRLNLFSHILKNKPFVIIMSIVLIIQIIILYYGGDVFRTYGLTVTEFRIAITFAFTVIPVDLMRKSYLRLHTSKENVAKFL